MTKARTKRRSGDGSVKARSAPAQIDAGLVDINDLIPMPRNAKSHAEREIATSIAEFGFIQPVVVNEITGHLMSGHGRIDALRAMQTAGTPAPDGVTVKRNRWLVPCHRVRVNAAEEYAASVALNRLVEAGGWDMDLLRQALPSYGVEMINLTGFAPADLNTNTVTTDKKPTCKCRHCGNEHATKPQA